MPKNVPSLKPKELIRLLKRGGCMFNREGKGDHRIYVRYCQGKKRVVPIDMGAGELSPPYMLRIQFIQPLYTLLLRVRGVRQVRQK
ncbi:MAG: addiction module toxin, HicA family [Candidatus Kuenenia stuttgartiensis]|nr:addiction module toxin, HicA family [Candidatus Kuenenia stuttgartiensis]